MADKVTLDMNTSIPLNQPVKLDMNTSVPLNGQNSSASKPISKNPYDATVSPSTQLDRAKNRDYGETSMSPGGPAPTSPEDPYAVKPNTLKSFISSAGIPTSEPEAVSAAQNILSPKADPNHDAASRFLESMPIFGGDARARADLFNRAKQEGGKRPTSSG